MSSVILFFIAIIMSSAGAIMLKISSGHLPPFSFSWNYILELLQNYHLIIGIALYLIPTVIWVYLLSKFPVSYIQPMLSLIYVLTPLLALFILKEPVSLWRWLGIAIVIIGVIIVARS